MGALGTDFRKCSEKLTIKRLFTKNPENQGYESNFMPKYVGAKLVLLKIHCTHANKVPANNIVLIHCQFVTFNGYHSSSLKCNLNR